MGDPMKIRYSGWMYDSDRERGDKPGEIVGRIVEREHRDDGEWVLCRPAYDGLNVSLLTTTWVRAEDVKPWVQPTYSRSRRRR